MKYIVYKNKGMCYGIPFCKILLVTNNHAKAKYFAARYLAEVVAIGELEELEDIQYENIYDNTL